MHPVEANKYLLNSLPMEEWVNWCANTIQGGLPGRVTAGNNRIGKTYATRWLKEHKDKLFGEDFPLIVMPQRYPELGTPKKFFSHLLASAGHVLAKGDESVLRQRMTELIVDRSSKMQFPRAVLLIDEAQWLELTHYNLLINVANELDVLGVRLTVLLIGHTALSDTVIRYTRQKRKHITGRFMSNVFLFRGIESAAELAYVLRQYDELQFYPEGSGVSFTRAFAGDRFDLGLRLAAYAGDLWSAMREKRQLAGRSGSLSVGMQTVTLIANELLLRVIGDLDPPYLISQPQWNAILDEIGFLSLED